MSPLLQQLNLEDAYEVGDLTIAKARGATVITLALTDVAACLSSEQWEGPRVSYAIAAAALGSLGDPVEYVCSDLEGTSGEGALIRLTPWPSSLGLAIEDRRSGDSAIIYLDPDSAAQVSVVMSSLLHRM